MTAVKQNVRWSPDLICNLTKLKPIKHDFLSMKDPNWIKSFSSKNLVVCPYYHCIWFSYDIWENVEIFILPLWIKLGHFNTVWRLVLSSATGIIRSRIWKFKSQRCWWSCPWLNASLCGLCSWVTDIRPVVLQESSTNQ